MKEKFAAISLIFCLVAPLTATMGWLHFQKKIVKKAVMRQIVAGIDRDELVLLKFSSEESSAQLRWEHEREFSYGGQMYDIVEKELRGDTVYYWCWWDSEETHLNKQLSELAGRVLGNNHQNKEHQKRLANFYLSLFCPEIPGWQLFFRQAELPVFFQPGELLHEAYPPLVPPPEIS